MQTLVLHSMQEVITSVAFVGLTLIGRYVLIRMIRRNSEILTKEQRRWMGRIKNGTIIIVLIGLTMIWAPQLQTFALSITAFAATLVIATREMILCLMGSLFRVSTQPYKVGDWISIDGTTGEVMEIDAFTTRLEEVDNRTYQFTGNSVSIPNSKLFTTQVENQNFMKLYIFQDLVVHVQYDKINPQDVSAKLNEIMIKHTEPFREEAGKFIRRVARKTGIDMPSSDARLSFKTTELGHFVYTAKIFVPTRQANEISALISQELLAYVYETRQSIIEEQPTIA